MPHFDTPKLVYFWTKFTFVSEIPNHGLPLLGQVMLVIMIAS